MASEWGVCRSCAAGLARDLAAVPAVAAEVTATLARQTGNGPRCGARSATQPLPYDPRASVVLGELKAVLVGWVRVLVEEGKGDWPADSVDSCAAWLAERVALLRVHPAAADITGEIRAAVGACWWAVDRPPPLWFAGPCPQCSAAMYARPEATSVRCPACAAICPTAGRRALMLESARDCHLTIPELGRALLVPTSTLRHWHQHGRLSPRGRSADGRCDTYLVGDVLDLLLA